MEANKPTFSPEEHAAVGQEMVRMLAEVKRKLKPCSKNELIRTICALLVDNYLLKQKQVSSEISQPTI